MYLFHIRFSFDVQILFNVLHLNSEPDNAVKAQTSLAPLSRFRGSHVTTAHAHQCCRFQSYAKTVPSRLILTLN